MKFRIGHGLDIHAFSAGNHVMLGGVRIPHDRGVDAHSDGDVALHALSDALLGAAALGDIGRHFSPTDDRWKDADSRDLLRQVSTMLKHKGWMPVNVDLTVICQSPKIVPYAEKMQLAIASDLGLEVDDVSIKATTTEGLGFSGRGEGITAQAIVLIQSW